MCNQSSGVTCSAISRPRRISIPSRVTVTVWPTSWYTQMAPLSWLIANAVAEGRSVLNFSEWTTYSPAQQRTLLDASCQTAKDGTMPGSAWMLLHPEARLSAQDIETICAAARQAR